MKTQNGTISVRQAVIIFILSTLSAAIRLFPSQSAGLGKEASWLAPIPAMLVLLLMQQVLLAFFRDNRVGDLGDAIRLSLGGAVGRFLIVVYFLWLSLIYFLYIRYYAERLLSSIFPSADLRFFILPMMVLVWMAARGRIEAYARFCEFSLLLFTLVFCIFFILLIPSVKLSNLYPITGTDVIPVLKATYPILGVWSYFTAIFFLGDSIGDKEQLRKAGKKGIVYLTVMTSLMMFFVVGSLGYTVARRMPLPFFNATKLISIIPPLNRQEPLLLACWMASDFIVIVLFAKILMQLIKKLFSGKEGKYFSSPIALWGYIGSQFLSTDRFELERFSVSIALYGNILLLFLVPVLVLAVGKLRKKL